MSVARERCPYLIVMKGDLELSVIQTRFCELKLPTDHLAGGLSATAPGLRDSPVRSHDGCAFSLHSLYIRVFLRGTVVLCCPSLPKVGYLAKLIRAFQLPRHDVPM